MWPGCRHLAPEGCAHLYQEYSTHYHSGDYDRCLATGGGNGKHRFMPETKKIELVVALGLSTATGHTVLHALWRQFLGAQQLNKSHHRARVADLLPHPRASQEPVIARTGSEQDAAVAGLLP